MKKYIVLSVNDNQDYLYFAPLVIWAWRRFGWDPILFYVVDTSRSSNELEELTLHKTADVGSQIRFIDPKSFPEYRSDTITQVSRLYGSMTIKHGSSSDYFMTGDIDMLPLSNYWNPTRRQNVRGQEVDMWETAPTVWGHDLTGFGHYPICYIGMNQAWWHEVMKLNVWDVDHYEIPFGDYNAAIKRDLGLLPQAKDPDFYKYWFSDQDLITSRLNGHGKDKINFINRGQGSHGFARGRVDRGNGGWVLNQPELIDAHLEQQTHHNMVKISRLFQLLYRVWPGENFDWFKEYTEEFRRITGHAG